VCVRVDLRGRSLAASAAGVTVATASQRCLPRLVSNVTGYLTPRHLLSPPKITIAAHLTLLCVI